MDLAHILVLALLQGVTELFPISSLGHTVVVPGILGWRSTLSSPIFLPLVVALHLGTAAALMTFFWRDWVALLTAGIRVTIAGRFTPDVDSEGYGRQLALVVVGTIPAGLLGLFLQHPLEHLFGEPIVAAAFLVANGALLLFGERLWRRQRVRNQARAILAGRPMRAQASAMLHAVAGHESETSVTLTDLSFRQAALIGCAQACALLPGISRSGATMVAGLANGLSHEDAARFSFLLATPLIALAGLLEIPKLVAAGPNTLMSALIGGVVAGAAAYLSVRFLMRYFTTKRLDPFAWYCVVVGLLAFGYFLLQYLGAPLIPA